MHKINSDNTFRTIVVLKQVEVPNGSAIELGTCWDHFSVHFCNLYNYKVQSPPRRQKYQLPNFLINQFFLKSFRVSPSHFSGPTFVSVSLLVMLSTFLGDLTMLTTILNAIGRRAFDTKRAKLQLSSSVNSGKWDTESRVVEKPALVANYWFVVLTGQKNLWKTCVWLEPVARAAVKRF